MASINYSARHKSYRIRFSVHLPTNRVRRDKWASSKALARTIQNKVSTLEDATKNRVARAEEIIAWVEEGYLKETEANLAFPGFADSYTMKKGVELGHTDYEALWQAWADSSATATAGSGGEIKNQQTSLAHGRFVLTWLKARFPQLQHFTADAAKELHGELTAKFKPWTVYTRMTKLRLILDQAVRLNMMKGNPARTLKLRQPKRTTAYQILDKAEVQWILATSEDYRHLISGGLPTAVRLGLYCGFRDIEMVWCSWDWIAWERRVIEVQATTCPITQRRWQPKDHESRTVPAPRELLDYLEVERTRQEEEGLLNQFLLPAGTNQNAAKCKLTPEDVKQIKRDFDNGVNRSQIAKQRGVSWNMIDHILKGKRWGSGGKSRFFGKPLDQGAPQKAFHKMMAAEDKVKVVDGREETIYSLYSMRHTFATTCLRSPEFGGRGLDIKTVQELLGHADIRQTEQYLRAMRMEEGLTDGLYT